MFIVQGVSVWVDKNKIKIKYIATAQFFTQLSAKSIDILALPFQNVVSATAAAGIAVGVIS